MTTPDQQGSLGLVSPGAFAIPEIITAHVQYGNTTFPVNFNTRTGAISRKDSVEHEWFRRSYVGQLVRLYFYGEVKIPKIGDIYGKFREVGRTGVFYIDQA